MAHILEDFYAVIWITSILINLGALIGNWHLCLKLLRLRVPFLCQSIYAAARLVMAFEGVAIYEPRRLINTNSATALTAQTAAAILCRHQLFSEGALLEVKIERVETYKSSEKHVLCLLITFETIAKNEATFLAGVPVEIDVDLKFPHQMLLKHRLLRLKHCWLLLRTRIQVKPIQIMVMCVQAVVAPSNSIRINQRYNLENILLQQ